MKSYRLVVPVVVTLVINFESEKELTDREVYKIGTEDKVWNLDVEKENDNDHSFNIYVEEYEILERTPTGNRYIVEVEEEEYG